MDHRDAAAESPEHLPELEADISAAENQQMLWNFRDFHERFVSEVADVFDPLQLRNFGARAGIDEDSLAFEHVAAHLNFVRREKLGLAAEHMEIAPGVHLLLVATAKLMDHCILARQH